jgi:signal transduction histidine kinase
MKREAADLLIVVCITVAAFVGAAQLELHEAFSSWVSGYERWQLDELPTTLLALSVGSSWLALRRWRDAQAEIDQRLLVERQIGALAARNRDLARELIVSQERERRALARDLHDELGQMCNAIHVEATYIVNLSEHQHAAAVESARRIATAVGGLYQIMRDMLRRLRPSALAELGIVPAIEELCESWSARTGISCRFKPEGITDAVDDAVAIALYRITQEGLSNVARHSGASSAEVGLRREARAEPCEAGYRLILTIDDNGRGMDDAARGSGLGLLGMRERVAVLSGAFVMESAPGRGLHLQAAIPAG